MSKITEYKNSLKQIKEFNEKIVILDSAQQKETYRLKYDVYQPKIRAIEKERDDMLETVKAKNEAEVQELNNFITSQRVIVKEVEQIYALIDLYMGNLENPYKPGVYLYTYSDIDEQGYYISNKRKIYYQAIESLGVDAYKSTALYVVDNGKPTNKYSLVLAYSTIFNNDILHKQWVYINKVNKENCTNIIILKEGPDKDKLISWYRKNDLPTEVKNLFDIHKKLETKYEEAVELYAIKEWKKGYLQWKKKYYENNYSRGTETSEYKAICKELESL